jgi:urea transport system permease protein
LGGIKKARLIFTRRAGINALILAFVALYPVAAGAYRTDVLAKTLALVILALSVDLLWGYTGILSLGQAVPFGLGAYIAAISDNVSRGIPDYMVTYGITQLPAAFMPLTVPAVGVALAVAVPAALSYLIGRLLLSGRVRGVFVSLITMAVANVATVYINNAQKFTGGSNGIGDITRPAPFGHALSIYGNYYFVMAAAVLAYAFCYYIGSSRLGRVLGAIRANENRAVFIGYRVSDYKVFIYVVSAALAAIAGMLYARTTGMVSPAVTGIRLSTLAVIWVAVGGRGNLTGAVAGCLALNGMERFAAGFLGDAWELAVGAILLLIVFFMPDGVIGAVLRFRPLRPAARAKGGGAGG